MEELKLFMILLGCRPAGRNTEQHDIFFGIATSLKNLVPDINSSWPGSGIIHIDAWREVTEVNGFNISVVEKENNVIESPQKQKLFFLNLGGYKAGEFEEYHYKVLSVANEKAEAVKESKQTAFYKHVGFKGAESHIDDRYGVDVDDMYEIKEILPAHIKEKYALQISPAADHSKKDEWHLGYVVLKKLFQQSGADIIQ